MLVSQAPIAVIAGLWHAIPRIKYSRQLQQLVDLYDRREINMPGPATSGVSENNLRRRM